MVQSHKEVLYKKKKKKSEFHLSVWKGDQLNKDFYKVLFSYFKML